jgi:putative ABC transport system permease protein
MWGRLTAWLRARIRRRAIDGEVDEELQFHLGEATAAYERQGLPRVEARRRALAELGGMTQTREAVRAVRATWLDALSYDVRHAARSLRRNPILTLVVVVTLALATGANTAIVSIVRGVLLRPLAYPQPAALMYFDAGPIPLSVAEYLEFQQFNRSFANVGAFRLGEANLLAGEQALRVRTAFVDAHLLNALGVQPAQGRLFTNADSSATAPPLPGGSAIAGPVALITYELWQAAFGGRPIVGQSLDVDGRRMQVIGVLRKGADLMDRHPDVWLPLGFTPGERLARNNHNLALIGRLRAGITESAAQGELRELTASWAARTGITPGPGHAGHVIAPTRIDNDQHSLRMVSLTEHILGRAARSIWVLQAAVALVLLIACANVTNLLLARAGTRQREMAVLIALGASRGRLLRRAMTESVLLALAGGGLGVLLAHAGVDSLVRAWPTSLPRLGEVTVDRAVMLVSLAVAMGCGVLCGIAPLVQTRAQATADALRAGARQSGGSARRRVRRALVVAEMALAVLVVVGAALLVRSVRNLTAVDAGFDRTQLATFSITLPRSSFDYAERVRLYQRILERVRAVSGVHGASAMSGLPLEREYLGNQTELVGDSQDAGSVILIDYQRVMSGFFETTGVAILQGRSFDPADAGSAGGVAIVNETLARTHWPGRNPIGRQLRPADTKPWFTVIGVARDVRQDGVDRPVRPEAYVLVDQFTAPPQSWVAISPTTMHVVLRTSLPPATLVPTIRRLVSETAPGIPVARMREMDEVFVDSIQRTRLLAQLVGGFGVLALLLAAIGAYGVLSWQVTERVREIGIRLALGATRAQVLSGVLTHGLMLSGIGVGIGLLIASALNQVIGTLLFGIGPTDAGTFAAVTAFMLLTTAFACWLPAWRASRVDASMVLQSD